MPIYPTFQLLAREIVKLFNSKLVEDQSTIICKEVESTYYVAPVGKREAKNDPIKNSVKVGGKLIAQWNSMGTKLKTLSTPPAAKKRRTTTKG